MRYLTARTVGDLREALTGVDADAPIVWEYAAPDGRWDDDCVATVEARPSTVFIGIDGSLESEEW